ncbi:MAG: recombination regulator RecX [Actinobacteria bacterium]|nr:recombination regulator RecX [Actinomycetota bacterium]
MPGDAETPFRDAEAWLAARGIEREPIHVAPPPRPSDEEAGDGRAPVSATEAVRLATEAPPPADGITETPLDAAPEGPVEDVVRRQLSDEVAEAVAYARRATANTPRSEARLREGMERKGFTGVVADLAMERAVKERLVDDAAFAVALVSEGRRKGHGPSRLRQTLAKRGLPDAVIDAAVAEAEDEDQEAAAFAVARQRAERLRNVDPEAAYRRLVGFVSRRGYPEALARKVARDALWTDREGQRSAER